MKSLRFISIATIVTFAYISLLYGPAGAGEPQRPNTNKTFSPEKEAKIQALKSLGTKEVFDKLKSSDFRINKDFTHKAVYIAYTNRRAEAISLAQNYLVLPLIEVVDGRRITRGPEFNTAKRIFEVFPKEAISSLKTFYHRSNAITRGNIISASGGIAEEPAVKEMLIKALDDKSVAEEETPEMLGEPLRVCDIAYNQLVLRYSIRSVLRTICSAHRIKVRDYHISILQDIL
jgi:hypothetical protein